MKIKTSWKFTLEEMEQLWLGLLDRQVELNSIKTGAGDSEDDGLEIVDNLIERLESAIDTIKQANQMAAEESSPKIRKICCDGMSESEVHKAIRSLTPNEVDELKKFKKLAEEKMGNPQPGLKAPLTPPAPKNPSPANVHRWEHTQSEYSIFGKKAGGNQS